MRMQQLSWLFLIPIYSVIIFSLEISLVFGQCSEDQQSLLIQLNNSLIFNQPSSQKLANWNQNVDFCNWTGVTCENGCVIGLDLSYESISGGLDDSSSLFRLKDIQDLNLSYNQFNSTIPTGFGKLTNLRVLNMSNAGFSGQIPIEISRLTRLVSLDLSASLFIQASTLKVESPNLMMLIENLKELKELYLDGVNISAGGNEWCKALSLSLPNLTVLSLSYCYLSGPIDHSLGNLRSLSVIRLDNNNLSTTVPEFFAEFSNLTSLHLALSGLYGQFPEKILQIRTLQTLDLSSNQQLQGFLPDFPSNGALQVLVLRNTDFSGTLPNSTGRLENLSRVDLGSCNFSGSIPNTVGNLKKLLYLDFSSNRFTGLIPSFSSSIKLGVLNLAHNRLVGSISSTNWENLQNLVNLDLRNNSLTGSIPPSLFRIPSIQKIQLNQNQFNGSFDKRTNFSAFLLDTLDLSSNQLGGPFPVSFFNLLGLKILSLSFNNFTGTLNLIKIQQLRNLSSLDLSCNSLVVDADDTNSSSILSSFPQITTLKLASCKLRRFPDFLRNQFKLYFLDLSDNKLQGVIPSWIWKVDNLQYLNLSCNSLSGFEGPLENHSSKLLLLDLHSNELQGPVPLTSSASFLDYSNNNFSSVIPTNIGDCISNTIFFSLSGNNIQGNIPESICNATNLQVLDLSNNSFSGSVPHCLTTVTNTLGVLNLRRNNLNGSIPDTFPDTCVLKTLDLSGNKIDGQVPTSLANCTMLEVLDLGNNKILDKFPCVLKNISTLRVLILRSNNFNGNIGCSGTRGVWTSLQIVDLAHNNFSGNISGKCLTTWKATMADEDEDEANSKSNHLLFKFLQFSDVNYQDTVTVTFKGLEMEVVKILRVFTSVDFSCNNLDGPIPYEMGEFRGLYYLNLSHNALSGQIPPSIGNLTQLESMDLSSNHLTGTIPAELGILTFLAVLNLSYNQLVGKIPTSTQLQSFSPDSFQGNEGLCGMPLPNSCRNEIKRPSSSPSSFLDSGSKHDWQFIYVGVGFGVGAAAAVSHVMFWEKGRKWSDDIVEKILSRVLPYMGLIYIDSNNRRVEPEEDSEEESSDIADDNEEFRFCVFCTKLDILARRVIHDPQCTCHFSPSFTSSSSSSSSSSVDILK